MMKSITSSLTEKNQIKPKQQQTLNKQKTPTTEQRKMKGPEPSDTSLKHSLPNFFSPKQNRSNYCSLKSQLKLQ